MKKPAKTPKPEKQDKTCENCNHKHFTQFLVHHYETGGFHCKWVCDKGHEWGKVCKEWEHD